jgi:GNAT superfamily N-acetyltransferase
MNYLTRPVEHSIESIELYSKLLLTVFPKTTHFTPSYLNWLYRENPEGTAVGFDAFAEKTNQLAGHYVAIPISAKFRGERRRGLLSLNTATHPEHQGQGLFTKLAASTYQLAMERGFEFVVGVANANSTPGFVKRLGFHLLCPLDAQVGAGPINRNQESRTYDFERVWDLNLLRWRLSNPMHRYYVSIVNGAALITSKTTIPGIKAVLGEFPTELISSERLIQSDQPFLRVWLGRYPEVSWKRTAYMPVPKFLRPSPLNLIFKNLGEGLALPDPANIFFRGVDFDAY